VAQLSTRRPTADQWLGLGLVADIGRACAAPCGPRWLGGCRPGRCALSLRRPVRPSRARPARPERIDLPGSCTGVRPAAGIRQCCCWAVIPLGGARIVALAVSLVGLAAALRLGWLLAGPGGAAGTALALFASALVWRLIPSMQIDLVQATGIAVTLWAIWRPTTRRWAIGGVASRRLDPDQGDGAASAHPAARSPWVEPRPRVIRLGAIFVGAAIATALWWWIVVWVSSGQVFPLNALSVARGARRCGPAPHRPLGGAVAGRDSRRLGRGRVAGSSGHWAAPAAGSGIINKSAGQKRNGGTSPRKNRESTTPINGAVEK